MTNNIITNAFQKAGIQERPHFKSDQAINLIIDDVIDNKRINAIKTTKALTGSSLREAKEFVDILFDTPTWELSLEVELYLDLNQLTELGDKLKPKEFNYDLL